MKKAMKAEIAALGDEVNNAIAILRDEALPSLGRLSTVHEPGYIAALRNDVAAAVDLARDALVMAGEHLAEVENLLTETEEATA